jgi:hypothetical protein
MTTVYTLELENNKYYVGKSNIPKIRILNHFQENGSEWTKKYKPINIISEIIGDSFDEEKYTLIAMDKYGIDNVRGGSYCKIKLSEFEKEKALQTINSIKDKCYNCGERGHFIKECKKSKSTQIPNEKCFCGNYKKKIKDDIICEVCYGIDDDLCFRCFRKGHFASDCYAKTTIMGDKIEELSGIKIEELSDVKIEELSDVKIEEELSDVKIEVFCCSYCDKEFDTLKGATCHENLYCKNKNNNIKQNNKYYKKGNSSSVCYAKELLDEQTEVFCCSYCDKEFDTLKGATCHENLYCKKNNKVKKT